MTKITLHSRVPKLHYFCRMLLNRQIIADMLSRLGIEDLNQLQSETLETAKEDGDLILLADTGSGKTLAFLLAVLTFIDEKTASTQALVVVPSREFRYLGDLADLIEMRATPVLLQATRFFRVYRWQHEIRPGLEGCAGVYRVAGAPGHVPFTVRRRNLDRLRGR